MSESTHRLGAFRLTHRLGEGGMAEVWAATHESFGGAAAVKVMLPGAESDIVRDAFVAEARSHAGLEHPNIVRLLDYGRVDERDEPPGGVTPGDAYLVMECADATVRDDVLPSSWDVLYRILGDVLRGLAYSHARGFVHRDLKPENVLRFGAEHPVYKLADFGIAQSVNLDETADRNTLSLAMGTPHYMAPEQFKGHWYEFGPPTDLYALGCVAFELCVGHVPYPQTALMALATAHLGAAIPALTPRFDVPDDFADWVTRLLQKSPRDRFRFAADALFALERLAAGFAGASSAAAAQSAAVVLDDAPTLVDALTDMMFGDTLEVSDLELDAVVNATSPSMPAIAAPINSEWRDHTRALEVPAPGLGLFALRETPVVGFGETRDELWAILRRVVDRREPNVVVLRGSSTAPVDALGTWLQQRAGEAGAAVTYDVFYTRAGGPREGLVALLENAFSTWGMHDDEAQRRIAGFVDEFVPEEVATSCREIATDLVLGGRGVEARQARAPSRGERRRVVGQVLASAAADRPYLAWIGGVQWGSDAIGFAERVLERADAAMVVLGVIDDELDSPTRQRLDTLAAADRGHLVDVREPSDEERLQLAQAMLPLQDETARELTEITRGDEVALRLLLDGLRRRDGLEATSVGYRLADGVRPPQGRAEVFEQAVSSVVGRNPRLAEPLELAAVLGRAPDTAELAAMLQPFGVSPRVLQDALEEQGLARSVGERWWFVHDGVVDVLQQTARATGRWQRHNAGCADVLLKRAVLDVPDLLLRAAQHLIAAGSIERALSPMFRAMRALLREDVPRVRLLHASYTKLCDDLELDEAHSARLDGAIIDMALLRVAGEIDASRDRAVAAIEAARRVGHRVAEVIALRHQARLEAASRNLNAAATLLLRAETVAADAAERTEQAAAARVLGQVYDQIGDFDRAIEALSRSADLYAEGGDEAAEGRVLTSLASVLSHAGRLDVARECAARALALARAAGGDGAAEASNILGDIARMEGDLGEARERYQEARARSAFGAPFNLKVVDLNLAIVDLAEGRLAEATGVFIELRQAFAAVKIEWLRTIATAGVAACAAMGGDHQDALSLLSEVESAMKRAPDADVAEILEIGRDRTSGALQARFDTVLDELRGRLTAE